MQKGRAPRHQSLVRPQDQDERAGQPRLGQPLRGRLRRRAGVEAVLRRRVPRRPRRRLRYACWENKELLWNGSIDGEFSKSPEADDGNIEIHGDECVYVFPDLLKAVAGTFRKGNLVGGFTYDVVDFVIPDVGLPFPVLSKKKQGSVIARSESTARDGPVTPQQKFRSHDN